MKHLAEATPETEAAEKDAYRQGHHSAGVDILIRRLAGKARHRASRYDQEKREAA